MDTKCVILKRMWSVVLAAAGLFTAPLSATLQAQEASQTAQADDVSLSEDGDITVGTAGHYYVNMPVTGTNTLTITADDITDGKGTFKVYDDGGKGGNYSDGCNGTLVLTAPTGYVLQLAGDIYTETVRDKLNIYNNSNTSGTPLLINVSSSSSGTKTDITTVTSLSNVMTIYFSSDNSGNYAGLDLTVIISKDEYTYSESTYCDLKNEMIVGGDIILKKGTYYKYDDGDGDTFVIYSGEIDGNGSVIDMANSGYRAFEIKGSGVTIKNLTIKNANFNGKGGAIYFNQSGTVENCTFIDNEASEDGGAVYFKDRGTVMNCNFTGNKATGDDCYGGAVYFHDNGTVKNCIFTGNSACGAGAVLIKGNGSVTNCDFINNTATTTGGGAIWFGSNGTVKDCIFTGNEASEDGGGVYFDSQSTVTNCNFVNNSAKEGGSIYASNGIVLDWTNATDFIFASSYGVGDGKVIKTADGKRFVAYTVDNTNPESPVETPVAIISGTVSDLSTIDGKMLRPIAVAEPDGQGGTTVSPGYLLSIVPSDITPASGKTADFTIGTTPYYIYKAGTTGGTIPLSVPNYGQQGAAFNEVDYFSNTNSLIDAAVTVSGDAATAALPWTGAQDVNIRRARYYCTGVKYQEWQDAEHPNVDRNTDDDVALGTKVYILTGNENINLPGGWYVVKNLNTDESNNSGIDAYYTGTVLFKGDTHLILADNARMDVGTATTPSTGNGIYADEGSLSIYAQSTGPDMGTINTFPNNGYTGIASSSIDVDNSLTINGGNISCTTNNLCGICATSSHGASTLSINGGNISCTVNGNHGIYVYSTSGVATMYINGGNISCSGSGDSGIAAFSSDNNANLLIKGGYISINDVNIKYGIRIYSDDNNTSVTINGGCVNLNVSNYGILSTGGLSSSNTSSLSILGGTFIDNSTNGIRVKPTNGVGNLTLGWKNAGDYIYAKNYSVKNNISIADGQYMMACTSADGTGTAFTGNFNKTDFAVNNGKYLRPAMYTISAPENVNLTVADNVGTKDPVTVGSGDAAKTYYLYSPDNTVTASLKNESLVTDFEFWDSSNYYAFLHLLDGTNTNEKPNANSVTVKMPAFDFKFVTYDLRIPSDGKKYLAFVDDIENITANYNDAVILVFLGLEKNPSTGAIEALFQRADDILDGMTLNDGDKNMIPEGLPVIFAKENANAYLPEYIRVGEPTSGNADDAAERIRAAASPLFMTGTAGQTIDGVLRAALTDANGDALTGSNGLALSLEAADYVFFLFNVDKFVPVAASAASVLSGRRYLLAVDKLTLLSLLNGSAATARTRDASATDGLTAASARADNGSARVWTFPLILGNDATGIISVSNGQSSTDNWYTIDGRRLQNRPAHKGVYINNGKKTVIK